MKGHHISFFQIINNDRMLTECITINALTVLFHEGRSLRLFGFSLGFRKNQTSMNNGIKFNKELDIAAETFRL